ncbi:glycosyltransferase family 2 protein [Celeribacter marinus]|uniref:glycosyltransferase family 2 protein n=1 Tax=Celeribacter marinus TaxID=1397108 RepID=UPI0031709F23
MRYTVAATVRNEGPFLLEWLAWQKMLGFDDVLFVHNDCTDHSTELMRVLADAGWCLEQEHFPEDTPPVRSGLDAMRAHDVMRSTDWLFICDVDEYLIPKVGNRTIAAFLNGKETQFAGVAVQWKVFGTSGLILYDDTFLHRTFTRGARTKSHPNAFFKSFLYQPLRFQKFSPHSPRGMTLDGDWSKAPTNWGRANGRPFDLDPNGEHRQRTKRPFITHDGAQLNHYVTKWIESVDFKMGNVCPLRKGDVPRYSEEFFDIHDRNDEYDGKALRFEDRFDTVYAQITAVPRVLELHHLCCADYIKAIHDKRGSNAQDDPRYRAHLTQAKNAAM